MSDATAENVTPTEPTPPPADVKPDGQTEVKPSEPAKAEPTSDITAAELAEAKAELARLQKEKADAEKAKLSEKERADAELAEAKTELAGIRRAAAFEKAGLEPEVKSLLDEYAGLGLEDDPTKFLAKFQKYIAKAAKAAATSGDVGARVNPTTGEGSGDKGQKKDKAYWDNQYYSPPQAGGSK